MTRKIKMGMIGGGQGAFIGAVHRMAAALDNQIELVCGAFSSNPENSRITGNELFLPEDRVYGSYPEMIEKEKMLPEGERMDFVSIVTPNNLHFAPAKMAMENGFHVVCDKPLAISLEQAKELASIVKETGLLFGLTHNYTGYPMVKQARQFAKDGTLGTIRKIVVEYPQGWLSTKLETTGQKQAEWRADPSRNGPAGSIGDIGTHAENLVEYITGLRIKELCADLTTFIDGRLLDDDANILLRFENGAKGVLHCSQVSVGEENSLSIRIYGEKAGLEWHQMEPNTLLFKRQNHSAQVYRSGVGEFSASVQAHTRLPAGHPEGFIEAFANIYRNFAITLRSKMNGEDPDPLYNDFPTVEDGVRGMLFIEKVVESSGSDQKWLAFGE